MVALLLLLLLFEPLLGLFRFENRHVLEITRMRPRTLSSDMVEVIHT